MFTFCFGYRKIVFCLVEQREGGVQNGKIDVERQKSSWVLSERLMVLLA